MTGMRPKIPTEGGFETPGLRKGGGHLWPLPGVVEKP